MREFLRSLFTVVLGIGAVLVFVSGLNAIGSFVYQEWEPASAGVRIRVLTGDDVLNAERLDALEEQFHELDAYVYEIGDGVSECVKANRASIEANIITMRLVAELHDIEVAGDGDLNRQVGKSGAIPFAEGAKKGIESDE